MKLFFLALAVASIAPEFALLPAANCEIAHDARQCQVAGPKDWSENERRVLHETMQRLRAHELVRGILAGAYENGYTGFQRYRTDTRSHPTDGHVAKFGPGFVLFTPKVIGITDAFFAMADVNDPLSGYRVGDLVLLHELIHAFDDRKQSSGAGFASLTGWEFKDGRWEYINRVSVSAYNGVFAETVTLYARGRYAEAWAQDRSFATSLKFPVPTIQSLAAPGESFADLLAHLIIDPKAAEYLTPAVVEWFQVNVFPELRRKG